MTDAYLCDRCGSYVDDAMEIGYGDGAHYGTANRQRHVCISCKDVFVEWLNKND